MLPLLLALAAPLVQDWTPPPPPPTVPSVAMAQPRFSPFVLPDGLRVVTQVAELEPLAVVLAELLSARLGRDVVMGSPPARSGDVVLTLGYTADEVGEGPEALSIEVFEDHVALSGRTPDGVARAAARMLQLLTRTPAGGEAAGETAGPPAWSLPAVRLDDAPRFTWRAVRVVGELDLASARRLLDVLFLGSFNALVLEGTGGVEDGGQARQWALVEGIAGAAAARGITVVVDRSSEPRPFALAAEGADPRPLLCRPGDPAGLAPFIGAGRPLIVAGGTWRPDPEVAGREARGPAEAAAYGWSPLGSLGVADAERARTASSLVIGSELELRGVEGVRAFAGVLPCLSERSWGAASAPETLSALLSRATALTSLVDLLGTPQTVAPVELRPGAARGDVPAPPPNSGR